jgi:hypothetical protein
MSTSYKRTEEFGKDTLYFISPEDAEKHTGIAEEKKEENKPEDAYNQETGEINWDCPCIAGMTQGPCGETFKSAFSCFVYSESEPKGSECIEQFRAMQECFSKHPDIYGKNEEEE